MKKVSFLLRQTISNVVWLTIISVLLIVGLCQANHISKSGYIMEIFPFSSRLLLVVQSTSATCLMSFILLNIQRDFTIFLSVDSPLEKTEKIIEIIMRELFSRTGIMLMALSGFFAVASWVGAQESGSFLTLFGYVTLANIGNWNTVSLVASDFQYPMTVLVSTSISLMLFSLSVALIVMFVYLLTFVDKLARVRKFVSNVIHIVGGIPFILPLLFFRTLYYNEVLQLNAIFQHSGVKAQSAYLGTEGFIIGVTTAGLFLGAQVASTLCLWLDSVELRILNSASYRLSELNGRTLFEQMWREGLWLSYRQEFLQMLLSGFAAIMLTDFLSGALLETLVILSRGDVPTMFSLYPSLGSILFYTEMVSPIGWLAFELNSPTFMVSLMMALLVSLLIVARIPVMKQSSYILSTSNGLGNLYLPNGKMLTYGVSLGNGWTKMGGINYVLGESGTGKTTYMRAIQNLYQTESIAIPQDPDSYFPSDMSVADVTNWVVGTDETRLKHVEEILRKTKDERILNTLQDVLTPVGLLSRGERQRFLFALAWSKVKCRIPNPKDSEKSVKTFVFMDEFTSAQDHIRASLMWDEINATLQQSNAKENCHVFIATHDPESLKKHRWYKPENRTFWFSKSVDNQPAKAHRLLLGPELTQDTTVTEFNKQSTPFDDFASNLLQMEEFEKKGSNVSSKTSGNSDILSYKFPEKGISLGPNTLKNQSCNNNQLRIYPKSLYLLQGPSGMGKSTLMGKIIQHALQNNHTTIGWIPQDPGRAFPPSMTVAEALLMDMYATDKNGVDKAEEAAKLMGYQKTDVDFWHRPVSTLSEGQRQRVCIAREYLRLSQTKTKSLMMLDEPFGSLDPKNHVSIMKDLTTWATKEINRSLFMISHTPNIEKGIADNMSVFEWTIRPPNNADLDDEKQEENKDNQWQKWKWYAFN